MTVGTLWAFLRMNNDDFNRALNSSMKKVLIFAAVSMAAAGGVGAAFAVVGTAVSAAIGAMAFGLAGLGVLAAAFRDDVKKAFTDLGSHVGTTMKSISGPIAAVLIGWAGELRRQFDTLAPLLEQAFAQMAPNLKRMGDALIRPISEGFQKIIPALVQIFGLVTPSVEALGPKIEKAFSFLSRELVPTFEALRPVVATLFDGLGNIGSGLAGFFNELTAAVGNGTTYWLQLTNVIELLLPALGSILGSLSQVGGVFLAMLIPALQAVLPVITAVFGFIGKNATIVGQAMVVFAALWAANWIRMRVVALINAAQMAAAWLIAMGPIGWIIAIVIALVVLIIMNWDKVKKYTIIVWNAVKDFCIMVWNAIVKYAVVAFNAFVAFWVYLWNVVKNFFVSVWNSVYDFCAMVLGKIRDFFVSVWNGIWSFLETVFGFIKLAVVTYFNFYKTIIMTIIDVIRTIIEVAWNVIKAIWETALSIIKTAVVSYFNFYKTIIMTVINVIRTIIETALNFIKTIFETTWNAVKTGTTTAWNFVKGIIDTTVTGIKGVINGLKTAVVTVIGDIVTTIRNIKDTIVGFFINAGQWLVEAGKKIIQGLIDGIKGMASKVTDAVGGVISKARDLLPFSPAKEGPLSGKGWTLYSGQSMMEGLAKGILSQGGSVSNAIGSVLDGAQYGMSPVRMLPGMASSSAVRSTSAPFQVNLYGPVYSDSAGIRRLGNELDSYMRQRFSNSGKNNGGRAY